MCSRAQVPLSWKSKFQKTVATSTCEAELMALAATVQEAIWLKRLLLELDTTKKGQPMQIHEDNQGAIALIRDHKFSTRTKHMDIKYFFVREHFHGGEFDLNYCETKNMLADIFTKPTARLIFCFIRQLLGVVEIINN